MPLDGLQSSRLHQEMKAIVQALQNNNKTYYAGTQSFQKQVVGSVSYFNGQFTAHGNTSPDYR
jgi:lauroyl/myristoyl acyltransferase